MDAVKKLIAKIYNTLVNDLEVTTSSDMDFLQMAWPGEQVKTSDFRNKDGEFDPNLIAETLSGIANTAPLFDKVRFVDSGNQIDELYYSIITGASFHSTNSINPLQKLIAEALREYSQNQRGFSNDPSNFYRLCKARPLDWYDDSDAGSWTHIKIEEQLEEPDEFDTPFYINGGKALLDTGILRTGPTLPSNHSIKELIDRKIQSLENATILQPDNSSLRREDGPINPWLLNSGYKLGPEGYPIYDEPSLDFYKKYKDIFDQDPLGEDLLAFRGRRLRNRLLGNDFLKKNLSADTKGFIISFDYRKIIIERPWLKLSLLRFPNWYIHGVEAKFFSNGTSIDNKKPFPLLPTSFILIRNLKISASWAENDFQSVLTSNSFGPFNLMGAVAKKSSIEMKDMQILAYTSQLTPPLAPLEPI